MTDIKSWEDTYKKLSNIWGIEPEHILKQYSPLVKDGKVLDLGIGEGRNSLMFAAKGHDIEGVDVSETALQRCGALFQEANSSYKLSRGNISEYDIEKNKYALIISTWTLNFMRKSEAKEVIKAAQAGLKSEGIAYIGVFSKDDPQMKMYQDLGYEMTEADTFYIPERKTMKCYFDKDELVEIIDDDCELICIKEDLSLDFGHGDEHYHGAIEMVIRRKVRV